MCILCICATALWFALTCAAAALAGQCGYERCWGAVGIGPDGVYGWSHSYASETAARDEAQAGCRGRCDRIQTFYNTCGAMAEDAGGAWGWGLGDSRQRAEETALQYCTSYGGRQCAIRAWACSW